MVCANVSTPPIFRLNDYVLLQIFTYIVYPYGRMPLGGHIYRDTLSISQVCSSWRQFVLEAPTLWTVIDTYGLESTSSSWKEEVMRRTKRAPLWLSGRMDRDSPPESVSFFMSVLRHQWSRMQTVELYVGLDTTSGVEGLQELFNKPAPMLTSFKFEVKRSLPETPQFPVFSHGEAPSLTVFSSNKFYPALSGSQYMTYLSDLSVASPYTALQLLELLENIPSLTRLTLKYDDMLPTTSQPLPYVIPPNLKYIEIRLDRGSFDQYVDILDHIRPLQQTRLYLVCGQGDKRYPFFPVDAPRVETFQRVLGRFSANSFKNMHHDTLSTIIEIQRYEFLLEVVYRGDDDVDNRPRYYRLFTFGSYLQGYDYLSDSDLFLLMDFAASCQLGGLKKLDLRGSLRRDIFVDSPETRLFQQFVSLEHFKVDADNLSHFRHVNLATIFPSLKVLELGYIETEEVPLLLPMMNDWIRVAVGPTARTLHVGNTLESVNLTLLDEVDNLRVTWHNGGEYVCGTGNSQLLDLDFSRRVSE